MPWTLGFRFLYDADKEGFQPNHMAPFQTQALGVLSESLPHFEVFSNLTCLLFLTAEGDNSGSWVVDVSIVPRGNNFQDFIGDYF